MAFSKLSLAKYHFLHKKLCLQFISGLQLSTELNFNLRYFMSSITTERLYKSFSFINSSSKNISQVESEILRNSSTIFRSSHRRRSIKKAILKHFVIFTGKHLCWGLFFNKVAGHQACNFIKKRLQHRYFLVNIRKFIRTPILKNICKRLHFWRVFCGNIFQIRP